MSFVLTLLLAFTATPFESTIERAFASLQDNDWSNAASALDEAYTSDPAMFEANNFHYLRGRAAEKQNDWVRAREEFQKVGPDNPLHGLASWHAAKASIQLHDDQAAQTFLASLPSGFPSMLKMQLARDPNGGTIAEKVYQDLSTREARLERGKALGTTDTFWSLVHESKDDDVAIAAARILMTSASSSKDQMELAEVFANHRVFEEALTLYQKASDDSTTAADARFQIARIHFQQEKYSQAIDDYQAIARDFAGTDWEKDSEYQIANSYWRLNDYRNSEKAYLSYIRKYGHEGMEEGATRNLVDIYRVTGETQKALTTLDRALAGQLSVSNRQVFLFTKAKILYTQKKYSAALLLFQQLGRTKLRSAPGSATAEEVQYFQALCQSKLGNKTDAETIWRRLARGESYYGLRAGAHLSKAAANKEPSVCPDQPGRTLKTVEQDVSGLRHPLRTMPDPSADIVSELIFLQLWDEAAFWLNESETRPPRRTAAEISYLGGQYDRAISLAGRLPRTESTLPLIYPAGYRTVICDAAAAYKVDPLWIHAIIWQESKYDPNSRSGAAARGLMQFIPDTANVVGSTIGLTNLTLDRLFDPSVSIRLGAAYWALLMQEFKSPELALAAYNGGPDNVQRWLDKSGDPELFVSDIGFVETKRYVMAVFAAHAAYSSLVTQ